MIHWLSNNWPYIVVGAICLGIAILGMRAILGPAEKEPEEDITVSEPPAVYVTDDSWRGFKEAHRHNPPNWAENDSWSEEFIPR